MAKYITLERILIVIALIVIVLLVNCNGRHGEDIIKTIPEYIKTTDTVVFTNIKEKKTYLYGKTIYIDSARYINYRKADTIKRDSMHTDAITMRSYDTIMEDNDRIKLELHSKVSGRLVNSSIKYTIKEIKVEPVTQRPTLSLVPVMKISTAKLIEFNTGLQFRNGLILQAGIDNNFNYSAGIGKSFTILK